MATDYKIVVVPDYYYYVFVYVCMCVYGGRVGQKNNQCMGNEIKQEHTDNGVLLDKPEHNTHLWMIRAQH